MSDRVCVVVGVGPGLGEALARAFAGRGDKVAVMSRSGAKLEGLAAELGGLAVSCDATDPASIEAAMNEVRTKLGPIHTLIWNVGSAVWGTLDDIDVAAMELGWRTNTLGLFVAAQQVVGDMRAQGDGAILVTGATATRRGKPFTTAFAAGKAAQRSLCQSLSRQLGPEGIHVALVIIDGRVYAPSNELAAEAQISPADAAATYLHVAEQPRTAWTFELEVRPHLENW